MFETIVMVNSQAITNISNLSPISVALIPVAIVNFIQSEAMFLFCFLATLLTPTISIFLILGCVRSYYKVQVKNLVSCLVIFCPTYFTTFKANQIKEKQRHVSRFYAHYQNNKCSGKDESCKSRDSMINRGMD